MNSKDSLHALELSIVPAVLASSCCLTLPALTLLGISFGEQVFLEHKWIFRVSACVVLLLSLAWYFFKKGIVSRVAYKENKNTIIVISLQTIIFALLLYVLFLHFIVPLLCHIAQIGTCSTY